MSKMEVIVSARKPNSPWNEESMKILKEMWELGKTSYEISTKLMSIGYSITRNAVIGKANRMNVKQPPRGASPKALKNQPRKRIIVPATHTYAQTWAKRKTKLPTKIDTKQLDPNNPGIPLIALSATACHAIVRDGNRHKLATYCGEPVQPGKSFCPGHCAIYYQPPHERRR